MLQHFLELVEPAILKVETLVRAIAADVPLVTNWTQSSYGSWYNEPRQHGLELLFLASFYGFATWVFLRRLLTPGSENFKLLTQFQPPRASLTERGMALSLILSLLLTLTHKIIRDRVWFMMQPCHMSSALAFPDLREHTMIGETFNFFAEHILLLVVPVYMIYSCRYVVLPKSKEILLGFFSYSFFHTPLLHITSFISGFNLNYMFAPPVIKLLLQLGPLYRIVMYGAEFVFKFVTRFICVETILAIMPCKKIPGITNSNSNSATTTPIMKSEKIN